MSKVDFGIYADDNTPFVIGNGVKEVINSLKEASDEMFLLACRQSNESES